MNLLHLAAALLIAQIYTSPDRTLTALVRTGPTGESRVQIRAASGRALLTRDDTSSDGSHGYRVIHAAWTPDSAFLVASTEAAGGHQPWAHPIWVYSRSKNQVFELANVGFMAIDDFALNAPDIIQVKVLDCKQDVIVSLREALRVTSSLPAADRLPCRK